MLVIKDNIFIFVITTKTAHLRLVCDKIMTSIKIIVKTF